VYRCPKCSSANLEVVVEVWATLIQNDDGFETDTTTPDDASHEWTDNNVMRCCDCDSQEIAERFNTDRGRQSPAVSAKPAGFLEAAH
jgi:hypothetical protein